MHTSAMTLLLAVCGADATNSFDIRVIAGDARSVNVEAVAADGTLTLTGGKTVSGGGWYSLRRVGGILPPWPRDPHLELTNGDRVRGVVAGADGDALRLTLASAAGPGQVLRFPLSSCRAVWLRSRPNDDWEPAWLAGPRKRDAIVSRGGDVTLGALEAIDVTKSQIRFQVDGKDRELPLSQASAIGFNTDLARVRRPKGPYYRITLADGTRMSCNSVAFDGRSWAVETLFKDSLKLQADKIVSIDVEQGKAVYLSTLKPARYQYQSFDGETHSWSADRSVAGRPMRLKTGGSEVTFDRGIGLHAECRIVYALAGKYRRFQALAGLDARTGVRGDVTVHVWVDGQEVPLRGGGRLTLAAGPLPIDVDVTGARELMIAVRPGNGGIVQDDVNLAEARLVP